MKTTTVEYDVDATHMVGRLYVPDGEGPAPGVLLCHEGPGIDGADLGPRHR